MIENEQFYVVHGWMINELGLSGVELDVYAIIYGFSQDGMSEFKGTAKYLEEWTGKSNPTVLKALNSLCEKGLVEKNEIPVANHLKLCNYKAVRGGKEILPPPKKFDRGGKETLPGGGKEILPHNNSIDNKNKIIDIVEYLNQRAGTAYKATTADTQKYIKARLKEGFTIDDFKAVIDHKTDEWKGTDMAKFLRPQTLFGNKFESYLNQKTVNKPSQPQQPANRFNNYTGRGTDYDALMNGIYS